MLQCLDLLEIKKANILNKLIIIGAGSVGGFLIHNQELFHEKYEVLGFLDDDLKKIGKNIFGYPVLGSINTLKDYEQKGMNLAIGIAFPQIKKYILNNIDITAFNFPSFISKNSWYARNVKIGQGVIIYPGVSINYNTTIEDFVVINMNCAIGHDSLIKKNSALAPGSNLAGHTKLLESVDFGIGAATKQYVTIGTNSIIGGNSMVITNVADNSTILGVPGKYK
jgi:sugar O-acyltransferase (sialic acid O-acetyltransferase NeuD family)